MNYWLVKSEPDEYSWDDFVRDRRADWTGVRNYQARNFLRQMKRKDQVFYYHSNRGLEIVGIAGVAREHYPDPTAADPEKWSAVDLVPVRPFPNAVSLAAIRKEPPLAEMKLVSSPRLSVQPVTREQWRYVLQMSR